MNITWRNRTFVSQLCALHLTSTRSSGSDMPAAGVFFIALLPGKLRHTACSVVCRILVKVCVCISFNIELSYTTTYVCATPFAGSDMCASWIHALNAGVLSQAVTLTGISLIDNNGDSSNGAFVGKGRLVATLTTSTSGVVAGPTTSTVCGPLDTVTALFLCNQLGYLSASRFGTVGELGWVTLNIWCRYAVTSLISYVNSYLYLVNDTYVG